MGISSSNIVNSALGKLEGKGFDVGNEHSKQREMVEAIVEAIVEEIKSNAKAVDPGGTSPGKWKIE